MALSKKQIEQFKEALLRLKKQQSSIVEEISKDVKNADGSKGMSQHQADEGTDDFDRTISLEVGVIDLGVLKQVDRALEKIEEGTYGVCDLTGEAIPQKRLEAIPYATTTVKAQEQMEKGIL